MNFEAISRTLTESLRLTRPPVAVSFASETPEGVAPFAGRVAAGCRFWQEGMTKTFATSQSDHDLCAIGQYTHNLGFSAGSEIDFTDTLKVLGDLTYVRGEDVPQIPVLNASPKAIVYGPLPAALSEPAVVLLFVRADQQLILSEATQQVEHGLAPAMGRPACAVVPQAANAQRAALSLGCCGARAYVDELTPDVAIYAIPGTKLEQYAERIAALAAANEVLSRFHSLRRKDVESGKAPAVKESLAALSAAQ